MNHFPELEEGAEELWQKAALDAEELYPGLVRYLDKQHGIHVRIARGEAERGVLRRFDAEKKLLTLSELLPTRSRTFQLAHQIALLTQRARIDRIVGRRAPHDATSRAASRASRSPTTSRAPCSCRTRRSSRRAGRSATTSTSSGGASASASSRSATGSRRCAARAPRACRST